MKKKIYVFSFIFFVLDLISKLLIIKSDVHQTVINNFLYIKKVTNTGAAFSIFSGATAIFILIAIVVLIYIFKEFINKVDTKLELIGISMLIGGVLGNLIDRIVYGKVVDFISFKFGSYYFPVFNLADTFIVLGVAFIIINSIRSSKDGNKSSRK